jgi:excisionase family DNA binding protein
MRSELLWLTTAQAAERTARHPVTVRRALEAGELHGGQRVKGGPWRIHRDCVDAWVLGEPCLHRRGGDGTEDRHRDGI